MGKINIWSFGLSISLLMPSPLVDPDRTSAYSSKNTLGFVKNSVLVMHTEASIFINN